MKKFSIIAVLVICATLFSISASAAPIMFWDLGDPNTALGWDIINHLTADFDTDENCLHATVTDVDPILARGLQGDKYFSAAEYPYLKISMKVVNGIAQNASIFWTTDKSSWSLDNCKDVMLNYEDDKWFEIIIDMSESATWTDTITAFRFDPLGVGYGGEEIYIKYVALFATRAEAEAFDYAAYTGGAVTEAPVTEAPVTEAPVTEAPVTEAPVTDSSPDTSDIILAVFPIAVIGAGIIMASRKKSKTTSEK